MKPITRREFLDVSAKGIAGAALGAGMIDELVNPNVTQAAGSANTSKSGVAEQVISLPKGGGAIKGLGEKFQPDLHTGTGNFTVPIQLPPGRSGFQPELALSYSTGGGNGPFGLGWDIGIPNVSRQTSKGVPTYDDKQDTFILSGAEDLVPVDGGYYQPRTEGLFARIRKIASPVDGQDCWEVTSKKNIRSYYGLDDNARVFTVENGGKKVFKWLLSQTADPCGNTILYHYQRDIKPEHFDDPEIQRTEANHEYHQVYLVEIAYMNFRETGDTEDQYFVRVQFDYGQFNDDGSSKADAGTTIWELFRPDRFSNYRAGFEIRTVRRCKRILIKVRDKEQKHVYLLAKSYNLEYLPYDPAKRYSNLSLLTSVTLQGYRDGETKSFPPLTFGYTEFWPQDRVFENFTAPAGSLPDRPLSDPNYELIDLTGNGLPDVIHTSRYGFRFWKNMGNCQFVGPIAMRQAPAGVLLEQPGVQFADMQGNGRADLLVTGGMSSGYYETTYGEENEWERFHPYTQAPDFAFEDPNVRLVDMDGDGVIDVLRTDTRAFMYFRNCSEKGFADPQPISRQHDMENFPDVYFSDPRVHLADMSGDGLQDIVFIHDRRIEYWPNLGRGRWGKRILMANAPDLHDGNGPNGQYDPKRLFFSDVDGDGLADLVYVAYDCMKVWLNQSGNGWSAPLIIRGTPPTSAASVRLADMKGTGTAGVLWTYEPALFRGSHYKYLDFTGDTKPYLLSTIDNNLGASTVVQYRPSTDFWIEDQKKAQPWLTHLPFPVQVVAKVEAIDHIAKSKLVTSYSYHHGYYDGREREFRGFGRAEQLDTETFDSYKTNHLHEGKIAQRLLPTPPDDLKKTLEGISYVPPVLSKTWFHPGIYVDEKKYLDKLRREYYQGDSQAFAPHFQIETGDAPFEAYRALRGAVLRTEVYALDGTALEKHPYVVTENGYQVRQVYPKGKNSFGIFLTNLWETFTYHYERNPADPRIAHTLNHEIDSYGNIVKSLSLAYPRRKEGYPEQKKQHVIYAYNRFINQDKSDQSYFIGVTCEAKQIEILLPEGKTYSPLEPDQVPLLDIDYPRHNLFSHVRTYYDGAAYEGLPLGEIGVQGLLTRSETLVLKKGQVTEVYGNRVTSDDLRSPEVGYVEDSEGSDNWWVRGQRMKYDAAQHYLLVGELDPLGHESRIEYDRFAFLPVKSIDPIGNVISAENDYLVMSPRLVTDFNDNRSAVAFDPLGYVKRTAVMGKAGSNEGDRLDDDSTATAVIKYDLWQYVNEENPTYAYAKAREEHHHINPNPRWMETWVYSDGFGREIQAKTQAEPGEVNGRYEEKRWVGTGWKIYNNKGKPVKQYEPFFSGTHKFENMEGKPTGVSSTLFYDPLSRAVAMLHPNQTYEKAVFDVWQQQTWDVNDTIHPTFRYDPRVPEALPDPNFNPVDDPDVGQYFLFLPSNEYWPTWYNLRMAAEKSTAKWPDEKIRTAERHAAEKAARHASTPTITHFDSLGRPFLTIADNGLDNNGNDQKYKTRVELDIQGNQRTVTDAKDRLVMRYDYDVLGNRIHQASMEAGERWVLIGVTGRPAYAWNSRGHTFRTEYDALHRPLRSYVKGADPSDPNHEILSVRVIYGDGPDTGLTDAEKLQANLRGKPYKQFDNAGRVTNREYDFKGNLRCSRHQLAKLDSDHKCVPDWSQNPELEDEEFESRTTYDALNRSIQLVAPHNINVGNFTTDVIQSFYNEASLLEKIDVWLKRAGEPNGLLDGQTADLHVVVDIDYNAKGQRVLIEYGNSTRTTYGYDMQTFRLTRLRTTRHNDADALQDLEYTYDPVGNITSIHDEAQQIIYFNGQVVEPHNEYTYDAIYRLISAKGREHIGQVDKPWPTWNDEFRVNQPHPHDGQKMRRYEEKYLYDAVGNFDKLIHIANNGNGSWTREYAYDEDSLIESEKKNNRLSGTKVGKTNDGKTSENYEYDEHGNMTCMPQLDKMIWDFKDQLQEVDLIGSEKAYYVYDAADQRVRKVVEKNGGGLIEERLYLGVFEIYRKRNGSGLVLERETLHIIDDKKRIALVETKTMDTNTPANSPSTLIRYQFDHHLTSACLELSDNGKVISYEEYYPYGNTSYQAISKDIEAAQKLYRHSGKEKDEESGFYYYGARYYATWLSRWISPDPAMSDANFYMYCGNNPINFEDKVGLAPDKSQEQESSVIDVPSQFLVPVQESDLNHTALRLKSGQLISLSSYLTIQSKLSLVETELAQPLLPNDLFKAFGKTYSRFGAAWQAGFQDVFCPDPFMKELSLYNILLIRQLPYPHELKLLGLSDQEIMKLQEKVKLFDGSVKLFYWWGFASGFLVFWGMEASTMPLGGSKGNVNEGGRILNWILKGAENDKYYSQLTWHQRWLYMIGQKTFSDSFYYSKNLDRFTSGKTGMDYVLGVVERGKWLQTNYPLRSSPINPFYLLNMRKTLRTGADPETRRLLMLIFPIKK